MAGAVSGAARGAIAAGHPLTARAGACVLADGGNAVDACIAAAFVAAVTEGPLTGPAGGGFLLVGEPDRQPVLLDCFFAEPTEALGQLEEVVVDFEDAGTQTFHVGEGSVAVPGLVAGLEEAHRRYSTREWAELVAPAVDLAREGRVPVDAPRAFLHGILRGILLRSDAGSRVYGDPECVITEELAETLERVRDSGSRAVADLLPELAGDISAYRVAEREPIEADVLGLRVIATPWPSRGGTIVLSILEQLAAAAEPTLEDQATAVHAAYGALAHGPLTGTTHISVVDAAGTAAALSSTLGSGSGVFRGGTQLNNMLGELDVIGAVARAPGDRLLSMMTPTLVEEAGRPRLVLGSAGSVRLAGAIAQVAWRALRSSLPLEAAIESPRLHVDGSVVHLEGGWAADAVSELGDRWEVVPWAGRNLFFGGVQAVARSAGGVLEAAGDPRRGGAGVVVR
jgi:gamma-glutamyltranspeptidase/glutathione hydrolase